MLKIENILLLTLIVICALISLTLVETVLGDDFITVFARDTYTTPLNDQDLPPIIEPEIKEDEDGWQVFRSDGYAFEIHYPATIISKDIPNQKYLNAGVEVPGETPVWEFRLEDPLFYKGTNLVDASLVIHISRGDAAVAACSEYKPGSRYKYKGDPLPVIEINGHQFWKDVIEEGVMGGIYQRISYRTVSQDACYELTQLIHSNNLEALPPGTVQAFDDEAAFQQLDQVLETFEFLDVPASFPPQSYPEPKSVEGAVDISSTVHVDGLDVSHWQGDINWGKVANNDYIFTFAKGTEGVGWTDSKFLTNINEGTAAGVYMGIYHFARPDLDNTGKEEAEYFLSVAGDYLESGYLRPVLDLEVGSNLGKNALSAWVLDWLRTVENQSGVAPLIYTNYNYVSYFLTDPVADYDLWIAYWNCDPSPTNSIPPTGMWSDWGFWQYCVKGAGYVPGIQAPIDVNIFNGVEEGLSEFDAASPLWVSLTNYTTSGPAPHHADITADVNGDAVGLIDYAFWWDCSELDAHFNLVESVCGELPRPEEGECLKNDNGERCNSVDNEVHMVEHTYQSEGTYTAKVIVDRGDLSPVEDRFVIRATSPILSVDVDPESPVNTLVGFDNEMTVDIDFKGSVAGALQVELIENLTSTVVAQSCQTVEGDVYHSRTYDFTYSKNQADTVLYKIWMRYRPLEDCPVMDVHPDDKYKEYVVEYEIPQHDKIGTYDHDQKTWYLKGELSSGWENSMNIMFGGANSNWIPVHGDWNGDNIDTIGFYAPEQKKWYLKEDLLDGWDNVFSIEFGSDDMSWIPITGDWDGDGVDTVGFFAPNQKIWYLKGDHQDGWINSTDFRFGGELFWIPIVGDWDNDGIDTPGFYVPEQKKWYLKNDQSNGWNSIVYFRFARGGDNWGFVLGDWNGNGKDNVGFYDPDLHKWHLKGDQENGWGNVYSLSFGDWDESANQVTGNW